MNGTIHYQRHGTKRVRFHYRPPQKMAVTAFDRQRSMLIGIVVLFAVFALSFSSVYENLTGFVTAPVSGTNYEVEAVADAEGKNLLVSVNVGENNVNGLYMELFYYCPKADADKDKCIDLCPWVTYGTAVTGKAWGSEIDVKKDDKLHTKFEEIKCVGKKLKFSDATLNNDKVKKGKIELFSLPLSQFQKASDESITLIANPVNVYEVEKGTDLFPTQDYVLTVSLKKGICVDPDTTYSAPNYFNNGASSLSIKSLKSRTEVTAGTESFTDKCSNYTRVIEGYCISEKELSWNGYDCSAGTTCVDGACCAGSEGKCEIKIQTVCNNNAICDSSETNVNCPGDCPLDKGSSSGGGGGGGGGCVAQWSCGAWGLCNSTKQQTRKCEDIGKQCRKPNVKIENQSCVCQESWECSAWSSCVMGKNTRICRDGRKCGTVISKPVESKGCQETVPEYVAPQQTYQPPVQQYEAPKVTSPDEQKPESTFWDQYSSWVMGGLTGLLFIVILVLSVLHFTKKSPQVTFNYDELKDWIKKERDAGTSDTDIEVILAQNTGWTKEEVEKIFSEMAAGQKVEMPKAS